MPIEALSGMQWAHGPGFAKMIAFVSNQSHTELGYCEVSDRSTVSIQYGTNSTSSSER